MLFKILSLAILFFLLRNLFRSWRLFQTLQAQHKSGQFGHGAQQNGASSKANPSSPSGQSSGQSGDIIEADYRVIDNNES